MLRRLLALGLVAFGFVGVLALGLSGGGRPAIAAPPPDGRYDIAVLEVGNHSNWDDVEFEALGESPGIFSYDWEFLDPEDIESQLSDFDVLIIPWTQNYNDWLDDDILDAIVEFVENGGTLIVHPVDENFAGQDELFDGFGSAYRIVWTGYDGDDNDVGILSSSNPLVSRPNELSESGLSGWGASIHNSIASAGSAWKFATEGPIGRVSACAPFGAGSLVVQGQDPEAHDSRSEGRLLIENEITVGRDGICAGEEEDDDDEPRQVVGGAAVAGFAAASDQARENRARANAAGAAAAAAAAAPPATSTVRPPSTGDGGLLDNGEKSGLIPVGTVLALAAGALVVGTGLRAHSRR